MGAIVCSYVITKGWQFDLLKAKLNLMNASIISQLLGTCMQHAHITHTHTYTHATAC